MRWRTIRWTGCDRGWLDASAAGFKQVGSGAGFLLLLLGISLVIAARAGHTITITPRQAEVTEGEVFGSLVWQASSAVPVVDLPTSLGWENPVPDPAWPLGMVHVAVRAVFAGVLVSTAVVLWRTWRKRSSPGQRHVDG